MSDGLSSYVGPAAGVLTSVLWTASSLLFTAAVRRLGPTVLNSLRLVMAVLFLAVTHRLLSGAWVPAAVPRQVMYLALSGVVGLAVGDQALFTAFVHLGPRLAMLVMATSPIFAALFGWVALGETVGGIALIGVALTIGGVGWVVLERPEEHSIGRHARRVEGVVLAFVAAACQGGGLLLSKQGMGHGWLPDGQHLGPQTATLLRMFFGAVGMLPILAVHYSRQRKRSASRGPRRRTDSVRAGCVFAAGGAAIGPFLGVWMSLVAVDRAPVGIAQTLCSLTPVFLLPFAVLIYKERISPRAVIGAVIAIAGCAVLFVAPR